MKTWAFISAAIPCLVAGLVCAAGPSTSQPMATSQPATTDDNPLYLAWAHFKVGTESTYDLSITQGGIVTTLPLHYDLADVSAEKITIVLNFPADTRVTIPAKLDKDKTTVVGWPELLYQLPYLPVVKDLSKHETLEIDGRKYDCAFGDIELGGMKIRQWYCSDVAGGLVKSQVVFDANTAMDLVLASVKGPN